MPRRSSMVLIRRRRVSKVQKLKSKLKKSFTPYVIFTCYCYSECITGKKDRETFKVLAEKWKKMSATEKEYFKIISKCINNFYNNRENEVKETINKRKRTSKDDVYGDYLDISLNDIFRSLAGAIENFESKFEI